MITVIFFMAEFAVLLGVVGYRKMGRPLGARQFRSFVFVLAGIAPLGIAALISDPTGRLVGLGRLAAVMASLSLLLLMGMRHQRGS